ncbi:hypothetical protein OJ599_03585 [Streptococcus anginosus]|nr:hypothetical protein [Streptococcus anginosus]MCW0993109.1 hypothetical protein [Streptococcus anginosus]
MLDKEKRIEKAFELIAIFIDKCNLSEIEKRNLKGLLMNIRSRMEIA